MTNIYARLIDDSGTRLLHSRHYTRTGCVLVDFETVYARRYTAG